jgi:4'-phosphopantetheinyl transferase
VTRQRGVGIDVEYVRAMQDAEGIARQFFSLEEQLFLQSLPVDQRTRAFFTTWTYKEVYIKAQGMGLSLPLDQFAVRYNRGSTTATLSLVGNEQEARHWSLVQILNRPDYIAAVAAPGSDWSICWRDGLPGSG